MLLSHKISKKKSVSQILNSLENLVLKIPYNPSILVKYLNSDVKFFFFDVTKLTFLFENTEQGKTAFDRKIMNYCSFKYIHRNIKIHHLFIIDCKILDTIKTLIKICT